MDDAGRWLTLDPDASAATVRAAYRGSLRSQRVRLSVVSIDVSSDCPWPDDVRPAVDALTARIASRSRGRLRRWRAPGITVDVDPRDDEAFAQVLAIAPFTIAGTGISHRPRIIWSGSDTGNSLAVRLTSTEEEETRLAIAEGGGRPDQLVPLRR